MPVKNAIILGVGLADNVSKDLDRLASGLRGKMRSLASAGAELTHGFTLPIIAAGAGMLKFAADLDAMKRALTANMGSAKAAAVEFEKLRKVAEAPGIGFEEALKGSIQLQALGASADDARYFLEGLAKAVSLSGGGQAEFARAQEQLIQMLGKGKLLQEDMKFLFQAAPKLRGVVQEIFGTSNPEALRDQVSFKEFISKTFAELQKLEGVGGSLKNSLENLWTSFKIGVGEIGLAISAAIGFGDSVDKMGRNINSIAREVTDWVRANKQLVNVLFEMLKYVAITGPFVRFAANIGLLVSLGAQGAIAMRNLATGVIAVDKATKLASVTASGWAATLGIVLLAANELGDLLDRKIYKDNKGNRIIKTDHDGRQYTQSFGAEVALGHEGRQYLPSKSSKFGMFPDLIPSIPEGGFPSTPEKPKDPSLDFIPNPFGDGGEDKKAAKAAAEALKDQLQLQRDMAEMFAESPVKSRYEIGGQRDGGLSKLHERLGQGMKMPGIDTKILTEYAAKLREVAVEEQLGAENKELIQMKMDAAASSYKSMVDSYGMGSPESLGLLEDWKAYSTLMDEIIAKEKALQVEQEKKNLQLQQGKVLMEGIAEGVSSLATEGAKGMASFAKSVMKAVSAIFKLAVVKYVEDSIEKLGFVGAIPAIIGGGVLVGAMDGLLGKISMAEGGVISGETMIRAGEYPGVGSNPELIAPANKMMKYIRQAVGESGGGAVHGIIRGRDIHLVSYMANADNSRIGSVKF